MKLTKLEFEIMNALWVLGPASVREVQESLPQDRRPAYTTVQTIINRLEDKKAVRRLKKIGNAYVYQPTVTQKSAQRRLVDDLLDLFGGAIQPIMSHLVEIGKLTLEDVRELEHLLENTESEKDFSSHGDSDALRTKNRGHKR